MSQANLNSITDYSEILKIYGVKYIKSQYYWQVRPIPEKKGWMLCLSVIHMQLAHLLTIVIPELLLHNIPFKVVQDVQTAEYQLNGSTGSINLGKLIFVYPTDDQQALLLAKRLIEITQSFKGPAIPSGHHLGGTVYTCYDQFIDLSDNNITKQSNVQENINWPFISLVRPGKFNNQKILNHRYYPIEVIKRDVKGDVIKAIYFKKLWQIRICLIKQGRQNMMVDEAGRDIRARIQWQYDLYQELKNDIKLPAVIDLFEKDDDLYLTFEYIKGISSNKWISNLYNSRTWLSLSAFEKKRILDHLIQILSLIQKMHLRHYIHRDISPENFLIDKNGVIYPIDLELAWCENSRQPTPPFMLGTPGFIAPEKLTVQTPTQKEDIYSIGALMIICFTSLSPVKFDTDIDTLYESLTFFTGNQQIPICISACMDEDPDKRPELSSIKAFLENYRDQLPQEISAAEHPIKSTDLHLKKIRSTIQSALLGLTFPALLSPGKCWISQTRQKKQQQENERLTTNLYKGWQIGVAGPMWVIAKAINAGLNIDACRPIYNNCWQYLLLQYNNYSFLEEPGLYYGLAGIALSLASGLDNGLLLSEGEVTGVIKNCFSKTSHQFNLSDGIAGQGIALLNAAPWLEKSFSDKLLNYYINQLLASQGSDGAWNIPSSSGKKGDIITGLDEGLAGVGWFLLSYLQKGTTPAVRQSCIRLMNWFIENARKNKNTYSWGVSSKSKLERHLSCGYGIPGITLLFIKAYEVLGNPIYRTIAESTLLALPQYPLKHDFGLIDGLAGLGSLYLEAYRVFQDQLWKEKAKWITEVFDHTSLHLSSSAGCWRTNESSIFTADLSIGVSGIISFLIKYITTSDKGHYLSVRE